MVGDVFAMDSIEFAALTDVGRVREHNEDNFLVDKKLALFVVCDGMGGHAAGEVASALAVRTVHEEIKKEADSDRGLRARQQGRRQGHQARHPEHARVRREPRLAAHPRGGGQGREEARHGHDARRACWSSATKGFIIHVGDSRIYMMRDGVVEQLTEDHTVYNELIKREEDAARASREARAEERHHARRRRLRARRSRTRWCSTLTAGDRFLLCSDGCWLLRGGSRKGSQRLGDPDADAAAKALDRRRQRARRQRQHHLRHRHGWGRDRDATRRAPSNCS